MRDLTELLIIDCLTPDAIILNGAKNCVSVLAYYLHKSLYIYILYKLKYWDCESFNLSYL